MFSTEIYDRIQKIYWMMWTYLLSPIYIPSTRTLYTQLFSGGKNIFNENMTRDCFDILHFCSQCQNIILIGYNIQEASQNMISNSYSGRPYPISFRTNTFYCDLSHIHDILPNFPHYTSPQTVNSHTIILQHTCTVGHCHELLPRDSHMN